MQINILQRGEEDKAKGLVVVIDVFRAFSTTCYIYENGAEKIIPVGEIELAYDLKKQNNEYILMGERNGYIQPGFDYGNSPWENRNVDFNGKTVVLTTTAGTQGIIRVKDIADEIITGSFVNAGAVINYIKHKNPDDVSLLCTDTPNNPARDEDMVCAKYIRNALTGEQNDFSKIKEHLQNDGPGDDFFNLSVTSRPKEDFELCLELNKFNFITKVELDENNTLYLKKITETSG